MDIIRELSHNDYHKQYFDLLSQLTDSPIPDYQDFILQLNMIHNNPNHFIYVVEKDNKIIASITLLIEPKFIHGIKNVGHIEDVVVDTNYRNLKLGKRLLEYCIERCKLFNCYKVILNCKKELVSYYKRYNFSDKNIEMSLYI